MRGHLPDAGAIRHDRHNQRDRQTDGGRHAVRQRAAVRLTRRVGGPAGYFSSYRPVQVVESISFRCVMKRATAFVTSALIGRCATFSACRRKM